MLEIFNNVLKNIGCSYCQENDYSDKKEIYQNWKLYLKETASSTSFTVGPI